MDESVRACTHRYALHPRRRENIYAPGVRVFHPVFPSLGYRPERGKLAASLAEVKGKGREEESSGRRSTG